ncbi:MFS general substrate transporter [Rhizopogon salebrosus TDB-379]|nr:MFS general substrate transporter [Rhizopogon salebrosus TDB-379]
MPPASGAGVPVICSRDPRVSLTNDVEQAKQNDQIHVYRLYRRRFAGLLGFMLFGLVTGMPWAWFGPISNDTSEDFAISVTQVNWLGNITSCVYIPVCLLVPVFCTRFGVRRCVEVGAASLLISAWVRYAGTIQTLSSNSAYALLMLGQVCKPFTFLFMPFTRFLFASTSCPHDIQSFAAISQPVFQVLGPKYSETWFDLKGRTTATMLIVIANPIGGALGQVISPLVGTSRQSILVLGIISTAVIPALFLIDNEPPTPPTYAGSKAPQSLHSLVRAMVGKTSPGEDAYMSPRERLDFAIILPLFAVIGAATNALSILSAQIFGPQGYSDTLSGLFGATLLLSGILACVVTAPLFDRVLTHHLGITLKTLIPIVAAAWLSLIWADTVCLRISGTYRRIVDLAQRGYLSWSINDHVRSPPITHDRYNHAELISPFSMKPNNTGGLFAIMVIIGTCSVTMLPVGLELGVELTRNADGSSAILWCIGNAFGIVFILAEGALRASATASPPYNMHAALVLNGVFVAVFSVSIFFVRAKQARREMDERMAQGACSSTYNESTGTVVMDELVGEKSGETGIDTIV